MILLKLIIVISRNAAEETNLITPRSFDNEKIYVDARMKRASLAIRVKLFHPFLLSSIRELILLTRSICSIKNLSLKIEIYFVRNYE